MMLSNIVLISGHILAQAEEDRNPRMPRQLS
jgi:hypothetical protein